MKTSTPTYATPELRLNHIRTLTNKIYTRTTLEKTLRGAPGLTQRDTCLLMAFFTCAELTPETRNEAVTLVLDLFKEFEDILSISPYTLIYTLIGGGRGEDPLDPTTIRLNKISNFVSQIWPSETFTATVHKTNFTPIQQELLVGYFFNPNIDQDSKVEASTFVLALFADYESVEDITASVVYYVLTGRLPSGIELQPKELKVRKLKDMEYLSFVVTAIQEIFTPESLIYTINRNPALDDEEKKTLIEYFLQHDDNDDNTAPITVITPVLFKLFPAREHSSEISREEVYRRLIDFSK